MNHSMLKKQVVKASMVWLLSGLSGVCVPGQRAGAATLADSVRMTPPSAPMAVADYDRDGRPDLVMARQGGVWWLRDAARPDSTWAPLPFEIPTGFEIDTIEAGDLNGDAGPDLVMTSIAAQRALVFMGSSKSAANASAQVIEVPGGVQAVEWWTPGQVLLLALATPRPYLTQIPGNALAISGPSAASESPVSASRFGISIDGVQGAGVLDFVAGPLGAAEAPLVGLMWQSTNDSGSQILFGELERSVVRRARVLRRKWPDIILKRGYTRLELGFATATKEMPILVAWRPGGSDLNSVMLNPDGTVRVTDVTAETLGFAVGEVRRISGPSGDEWLIRDADATRVVIYRASFDGRFLVARDLVAPAGERFESAFGLADGGVVATLARAGGTGKTLAAEWLGVYQSREGKLELITRSALPTPARLGWRASVLVYERDPFLDPLAKELEALSAGDWTRQAALVSGGVSVTTETFKSDRTGLGLVDVREVKTSQTLPAEAYVMANQWRPDTSVFFGRPTRGPGTRDVEPGGGAVTDSDRDGMEDAWERWCFAGLEVGPDDDRDGDGYGALAEYQSATDPNDARSRPTVGDAEMTVVQLTVSATGQVGLRWEGPATFAYVVESSEDLARWGVAGGSLVVAGEEWEWQEEAEAGRTRFYRVKRAVAERGQP
jgi:hypothetical protein